MQHKIATLAILITTFAPMVGAQQSKIVPYEIRSKFRSAGCEIIIAQEAMRTDLKRQSVYVASCSGLETYLMAVKCQGDRCRVLN
ncbi:MAG: hypothetical protein AAF387_17485 [Pseudomonadota bacterium]